MVYLFQKITHMALSLKNNTQIISICSEVFNSRKEKVIKLKSIDSSLIKEINFI